MSTTVGLISLGCAKNLIDSEVMMGHLAEAGMSLTSEAELADVLIVNTCSFIDMAKQESIDAIFGAVNARKDDPERGPQVRLCDLDARFRLLSEGELAWVRGERGQQLAEVVIDDSFPQHTCGLRDIPGVLAADPLDELRMRRDRKRAGG